MILIRNGNIVDGIKNAAYKGDILISGDKISAIGAFPSKKNVEVVDALGYYVVPGFIDVNTDSDHDLSLFTNPLQGNFLLQGVTTIIGGHCGASLAPLIYGSLSSIRKWVDTNKINVDWHTVAEFFKILSVKKLGVNFGTLAGQSTIRRAIIGEDLRDLTDRELQVFSFILEEALKDGSLGSSSGLGYAHSKLVSHGELLTLAKIVAQYGGVYSTHLRNEREGLIQSIEETVYLARETGVKTLISHLRPIIGNEKQISHARTIFQNLPDSLNLRFDTFPFDASYLTLYTFLPEWAKRGNLESMLEKILNPVSKVQIKEAMRGTLKEDMLIAAAPNNHYLVGKTIGKFAEGEAVDLEEAMLRLMLLTRMRAMIIHKDINIGVAQEMIFDKRALLASNSGGANDPDVILPERATSTFIKFLKLAASKGITLPEVIKKITSLPAKMFNLKKRGSIEQGNFADIAIIKENKISGVIVNGKIAVRDGALQKIFGGQILKRS